MKFECPNCKKAGHVDDSKVPDAGVYATCPQCNNKFLIKREVPREFEFEPAKPVLQGTPSHTTTSQSPNSNETPKTKTICSVNSLKKINPHIYSIGVYGGTLSFICLYFVAKAGNKELMVVFGLVGLIGYCWGCIYWLVSLGRCWSIIQGTTARTTPGKAVGFLFIPFFNIYWTFIAYVGLATDANKFADSQCLKSRINYSLAVATCIIMLIPYLNIISFIFFTVLIYQMAAFHNEIIDKWDELTELPDASKSANVVVIAIVAIFLTLGIIGILAAIAIPQFSAYREKGYASRMQKVETPAPAAAEAPPTASDTNLKPYTGEVVPLPQAKKVYSPGWTLWLSNNDEKIYIDYSTIRKSGHDTITYKLKEVFIGSEEPAEALKTIEVNCTENKSRCLEDIIKMRDGNVHPSGSISPDWIFHTPGRNAYGVVEICAIAREQ